MVTNLKAINRVIQPLISLKSVISFSSLFPKWCPLIDLKECFHTIPSEGKDREKIAFTGSTYSNYQPAKR